MKIKTSLSARIEAIGKKVVDAAYRVHKAIGPGLLESVYGKCLVYELQQLGLKLKTQVIIPFFYEGKNLDLDLRVDILVEDSVIIELKAVEKMIPLYQAQLISYLKLTNNRLVF